jgi:hypothetical protein
MQYSMKNQPKGESEGKILPPERLSQEITRKLSSIVEAFNKNAMPTADNIDEIERLSKLRAFLSAERRHHRKQTEIAALCAAVLLFLGLSVVRLRSTAVDLEVRATKVNLRLNEEQSVTLLPGEMGQILALRQARVSGADNIDPPEVGQSGSFELRQIILNDKNKANSAQNLTVRLQVISIPEGSPHSVALGVAYGADSRGLTIETSGPSPVTTQFGEVINVGPPTRYELRPVRATGKNLAIEIFPANADRSLTVFRDLHISDIGFEDSGHTTLLGGSIHVNNSGEASTQLLPSDRVTIKSSNPMLLRELAFTNGELRVKLSAPTANTIQLGENSPRNLVPTLFAWIRYRWPTQLYATLSALVVLWLAIRQWWGSSE